MSMSKKDKNFIWKDGVGLRDFLEQRINDSEAKFELNLKLNNVAQEKADQKMESRLQGMNEFREQLKTQASTFMSRDFYDARHSELQKQVDDLRLNRANLEGKASQQSVMIAFLIAIAGIAISVISLFVK